MHEWVPSTNWLLVNSVPTRNGYFPNDLLGRQGRQFTGNPVTAAKTPRAGSLSLPSRIPPLSLSLSVPQTPSPVPAFPFHSWLPQHIKQNPDPWTWQKENHLCFLWDPSTSSLHEIYWEEMPAMVA